jgi:hypothetical protein
MNNYWIKVALWVFFSQRYFSYYIFSVQKSLNIKILAISQGVLARRGSVDESNLQHFVSLPVTHKGIK